jgi:hypothetical protein
MIVAPWRCIDAIQPDEPRSVNAGRVGEATNRRRSGEISVHDRWTGGGRPSEFWGLTKSFGDNPGDSKIPLDLGLCIRECIPRTGERTPTGAERPSLPSDTFGWSGEENDFSSRGGGDSGRGEKPHVSKRRVPGNRGGERRGSCGAPSLPACRRPRAAQHRFDRSRGHPNCSRGRRTGGAIGVGTGNRVSVNGARPLGRATGSESNFGNGGSGNRSDRAGGHRRRATGGGADGNGSGQPETGPNGHRPPSLRARRAMCRSSEG